MNLNIFKSLLLLLYPSFLTHIPQVIYQIKGIYTGSMKLQYILLNNCISISLSFLLMIVSSYYKPNFDLNRLTIYTKSLFKQYSLIFAYFLCVTGFRFGFLASYIVAFYVLLLMIATNMIPSKVHKE